MICRSKRVNRYKHPLLIHGLLTGTAFSGVFWLLSAARYRVEFYRSETGAATISWMKES